MHLDGEDIGVDIHALTNAKGDAIMYIQQIKKCLPLMLAAAAALTPASAPAATATDTFQVTANVLGSCSVSATDLAFGDYTPTSGTPLDQTSTVSVTCTTGTTYDVGLNEGLNDYGNGVTGRRMVYATTNFLAYALYSDSGRTTNWGNTVDTDTVDGTGNGSAQDITVYGRVPINQYVTAGGYSDTITVTVTY